MDIIHSQFMIYIILYEYDDVLWNKCTICNRSFAMFVTYRNMNTFVTHFITENNNFHGIKWYQKIVNKLKLNVYKGCKLHINKKTFNYVSKRFIPMNFKSIHLIDILFYYYCSTGHGIIRILSYHVEWSTLC